MDLLILKNKGPSSQSYGFSRSHVCMWELDCKESWAPKNWCFWTVVLEKTLWQSPGQEIQLVHPEGNQSWIFIGRTVAEAETPILWPPDAKNWLIRKDPDAEKDWRQEKGTTEDNMMASLTKWTWVWVNSGSWWWTRRPGVLQSMGWQRARHDWLTELNWIFKNVVFGWYRYSVGFFLYFGRLYVSFLWYSRNMNYNKLVIFLHLPAGSFAQGRSYQVCQEADDANTENKIEMYRYWVKNTHLVHSLV